MSTTLAIEYGYGRATHAGPQGTLVGMLLGTVMAMMGSMALDGTQVLPKIRTAVFFPVAIGTGMVIGVSVAGHTDAMLAVFVAVMFVAVFIRRFGLPYFFYGFMIWMGYFFAAFLDARLAQLPDLLAAVGIATGWVLLLSTTVLRAHPQRTLTRVRRAFGARAGAVARVCADLLETDPEDVRRLARLRRELHSRQLRLAETALVIEGWSAHPGTLPPGRSAAGVRRRTLDAHLAVDAVATAADALAGTGGRLAPEAAAIAAHLARSEYAAAERRARDVLSLVDSDDPVTAARAEPATDCFAYHLATAAWEFTVLVREVRRAAEADVGRSHNGSGHKVRRPKAAQGAADGPGRDTRPAHGTHNDALDAPADFAPAVTLAMGGLPGSAAVAGGVSARGGWRRLSGLSLTTRQAIQVAVAGTLAIVIGRELSEARYYWAVIAAFIAFTGTATRSETFIKATNRVVGTLLGLGAGIGLAHLTAGHTLWVIAVIVLSMSCGFYLVSLSYAAMIFFVTIMVSQLYTQLHEFSAGLLMLRLEETAIGAAIGIAVALVVLPTSTRDTVSSARGSYFAAVGELLHAAAARLEHDGRPDREDGSASPDGADLDALVRVVDHRLQQLALVARPLTRPLVWGNDPRLVRHRLTLYAAVTRQTRALALGPRRSPGLAPAPHLAEASRALGHAATALALAPAPQGRPAAEVARALRTADAALLTRLPAAGTVLPPVTRPLLRLRQLLHELAVLPPGHGVGRGFTGRGAGPADTSRIVTGSHAALPVRDTPHGVTAGAAGERPGPGDDLPHASGAAGDGAPRRP
ncbi:FUSC family protein [Streptomyces sp. NPDC087422]|uniref:FUSC family protein n=1 Tax=Streptomyces sp. NPDC087422 TaxID=3365786 RepID=UPI0037F10B55